MGDVTRKVVLSREQLDDLRLLAAIEGVSVAEVIRRALATYTNQRKTRRPA